MEPSIYKICFPDIFECIAVFLDVSDIARLALTNRHLHRYVQQTGLLYRLIPLPLRRPKQRNPEKFGDDLEQLLTCLLKSPFNACTVTYLSIRHQFSGYTPNEEFKYIESLAELAKQCPNLLALSLHLSNFSSSYYVPHSLYDFRRHPWGATRAFLSQGPCCHTFDKSPFPARSLHSLLSHLRNLKSLDWCVECRPSGVLSEDWKVSRLREELELIDRACPHLEKLGLLNFFDSRVSDTLIGMFSMEGTEEFDLEGDNVISGIFPNLTDMTFYVVGERDEEKILSAAALGMTLRLGRKIRSNIVPWHRDGGSQLLIVQDIGYLERLQELLEVQLHMDLDDFGVLWGRYLDDGIIMQASLSAYNLTELAAISRFAYYSTTLNLALDFETPDLDLSKIALPKNTTSLSIETATATLPGIRHLTAHLKLRSLAVQFADTGDDPSDETVTVTLYRRRRRESFRTEWSSEPIMASLWGDMAGCDHEPNAFEALIGRAITRTTCESRSNLKTIATSLFEPSSCLIVDITVPYSMFSEEFAKPRLFTLE
jgi:hypothetical protein